MSHGLALTAAAVALGATGALQLTRLLGYLLDEVIPRDPVVFGAAFVVLVVIQAGACMSSTCRP
jgi:hypothetical protein